MKLIADLHLHSHYARATSKELNLANLEKYARIKGLGLLGTGDFQHPKWRQEVKSELEEGGNGILRSRTGFPFIWQTEISLVYTQDGKGRRVHHIILAPGNEIADQASAALAGKGRLDYDGRPIFGFSSIELVDMMMSISPDIEIIPAHAWTPWFSIFGSNSGFNSIKECFRDRADKIHAIETGLSCYDEETDVLTNNGWKKFFEVNYTDKICTLNAKSNSIQFQYPNKIFKYRYKGKMYRLKTKRIDLLVTPNHRLFATTCDFRNPKPFFLREAEFLFGKSKQFKKDGEWAVEEEEYFILPHVKIRHGSRFYRGFREKKPRKLDLKSWLKFFGFWIAEGWTTEGKNGDYNVCVSNTNEGLIAEMKTVLEGFGFQTFYARKNYTLRVRDYQLFSYLKQFGKAGDKFIPPDVKSLSKNLLLILLEYYIKGDGHIYGRTGKGLSATTTSIKLRDDLQEIALKVGMSAYYKLHNKKGTLFASPGTGKAYKQRNDSWVIYFIRRNKHAVLPSFVKKYKRNYTEKWVNFIGNVYCLSVPNQVIYVRRNGIPVWCGNSDPPMNWRISGLDKIALISNSDSHSYWPWRIGREANIFDLKELSYKAIIRAIRNRELAATIEVDPAYGKYHYDGHRLCNVCMAPKEAIAGNNICPKCRRRLTIGVLHRVEELADRPEGYKPKEAVPFYSLIPLSEIIAEVTGIGIASNKVWKTFNDLISRFGTEFNILLDAPYEELQKTAGEKIASAIIANREGKLTIQPGYDGEYGKPVFENELPKKPKKDVTGISQKGLGEYF